MFSKGHNTKVLKLTFGERKSTVIESERDIASDGRRLIEERTELWQKVT